MTLEYESELLFDLMKRDGEDAPSDVLPYESVLKEKYLNQVVGAYPKLQDYRPEWLYYNLYHHLPSDFPVETLSNVTSATFDNVVPYAYKSAILKGATLVNLPTSTRSGNLQSNYVQILTQDDLSLLKPSTKYFLKIFNHTSEDKKYTTHPTLFVFQSTPVLANSSSTYIISTNSDVSSGSCLLRNETNHDLDNSLDVLLIEYQDGMENWDIPYFEGMKSVQMPVLTTSNEDGTKTNILTVNEGVTLRSNGDICDELNLLTGQLTQRIGEDGVVLSQEVVKTFDLSCINEQGESATFRPIEGTMHVNTSSQTLPPLLDMSVPVEATTQNLMSFANIEEEE